MAKSKGLIMINEYRQMIYLEKLYKKNTMNNYFKYSGKLEIGKRFKEPKGDYVYKHRTIIKNDMSKYKFKK
jgi:hypothetical protein